MHLLGCANIGMEKNYSLHFIDYLVVILNITFNLSLVKVYTFDLLPLHPLLWLTLFNFIAFFSRIRNRRMPFRYIGNEPLLLLMVCIYIFDILQNLFFNPIFAIARFFTFVSVLLFVLYILGIYYELILRHNTPFINIHKPYIFYSYYNIATILLCAALCILGLVDPSSNPITDNSLIHDNVSSGSQYYFPLFLSVTEGASRLFGQIGLPGFTGLSHEPHVINYIILPSFFISRLLIKKRLLLYLSYVFYFLFLLCSWSTTAFLAFIVVIVIHTIWSIIIKREMGFIIPLFVVAGIVILYGGELLDLIRLEFVRKTVEQTGSVDYTSNMWQYLLHPTSLIGTGNIPMMAPSSNATSSYDIGLISFALDILFFLLIIFKMLQCVLNRNIGVHCLGCSFLYFFLHCIKVNMLVFNYPLFAFMIVLLSVTTRVVKTNKQVI